MENIIYNELLRRDYSVDVGVVEIREKDEKGNSVRKQIEVDFVVNQGSQRYYIQSAFALPTPDNLMGASVKDMGTSLCAITKMEMSPDVVLNLVR